jgi:hypothetical protein
MAGRVERLGEPPRLGASIELSAARDMSTVSAKPDVPAESDMPGMLGKLIALERSDSFERSKFDKSDKLKFDKLRFGKLDVISEMPSETFRKWYWKCRRRRQKCCRKYRK